MLDRLVEKLKELIAELASELARTTLAGQVIDEWVKAMERLLARYHLAAHMAGSGSTELDDEAVKATTKAITAQVAFLRNFALEIKDGKEWQKGYEARAASYADAIGLPYWQGKTNMLPLPALPRDGTSQCITHCTCRWELNQLEGDGNWDCFWKLSTRPGHDECQTCKQRAGEWNPLKIRNGRIQL